MNVVQFLGMFIMTLFSRPKIRTQAVPETSNFGSASSVARAEVGLPPSLLSPRHWWPQLGVGLCPFFLVLLFIDHYMLSFFILFNFY